MLFYVFFRSKVRFAAFYGDCEHEILPVKSGVRVTMTYLIYAAEQYNRYPRDEDEDDENEDLDAKAQTHSWKVKAPRLQCRSDSLTGLVSSIAVGRLPDDVIHKAGVAFVNLIRSVQSQNRWMGIILSHRYTETGIQPRNLKGIDSALYRLVEQEKSCKVKVSSVLIHEQWEFYDYESMEEGEAEPPKEAAQVFSFTPSDIAYFACATDPLVPLDVPTDGSIRFVQLGFGQGIQYHEMPCHHSGNQIDAGVCDGLYMACALIIGPADAPQ
jgi:hypothetical protein